MKGRQEIYVLDGKRHREDGPAVTYRHPDGALERAVYYDHGRRHRLDGPALIIGLSTGVITKETYYREDTPHRDGGPAETDYDIDGELSRQRWWCRGRLSRIDGPALEARRGAGDPEHRFYFRDQIHPDLASVHRALALRPSEEIEAEVRASSTYAPLLDEGIAAEAVARALSEGVMTPAGIRSVVVDGAPAEWVRGFEEGSSS